MDGLHESNNSEPGFSLDQALMAELEKHLGKETATAFMTALDAEMERTEQSAFLEGFRLATAWISGPKWGPATIAILTGALEKSDYKLAKELGVSPAAVGKHVRRLRANAGLTLRSPEKSHGMEISKGIAKKKKRNAALMPVADPVKPKENPAK